MLRVEDAGEVWFCRRPAVVLHMAGVDQSSWGRAKRLGDGVVEAEEILRDAINEVG